MFIKKRGQSILEYSLIFAAVIVALVAINVYMKRSMQGRLRESSDQIGKQFDPENFGNSWNTQSAGTTSTTETREALTGNTTSNTTQSETITRGEHDEYNNPTGNVPGSYY